MRVQGTRAGQLVRRKTVGLHQIIVWMVMQGAVLVGRRRLVRRAGMAPRHLVAGVARQLVQVVRTDARRTHRGTYRSGKHADRKDDCHDPRAYCSRSRHRNPPIIYPRPKSRSRRVLEFSRSRVPGGGGNRKSRGDGCKPGSFLNHFLGHRTKQQNAPPGFL